MLALRGQDPFRVEIDSLHEEFDMASEEVYRLKNLYCDVLKKTIENEKKMIDANRVLLSYQKLVENLRERLVEKDITIKRIMTDYNRLFYTKNDSQK